MGNAESLQMDRFPRILHDLLNGEGSVGNPESLKIIRFQCICMISLMEKEAWETQNHRKCLIFMHFHDFLNGEGNVGNPESLKML